MAVNIRNYPFFIETHLHCVCEKKSTSFEVLFFVLFIIYHW